ALLPEVPDNAEDLGSAELRSGQIRWTSIDSPWVHDADRAQFRPKLDQFRAIEPSMVYSSHLPPAPGAMLDVFVESLAMTPDAERFEGPDQAALEAMLAGLGGVPVTTGGS
ncbi:MAG: MBL fold metallo-hydrolase, partial [Gemmatimonadota bacterium]